MTCWTDLVLDSEKIKAIFPKTIPPLESINLHEIILHRDGPRITLRFDLAAYPAIPPKKWQLQGYNRVQIQLTLIGTTAVSIAGWAVECKLTLALQECNGQIKVSGANNVVKFDALADFVSITNMSAYRDDTNECVAQL